MIWSAERKILIDFMGQLVEERFVWKLGHRVDRDTAFPSEAVGVAVVVIRLKKVSPS